MSKKKVKEDRRTKTPFFKKKQVELLTAGSDEDFHHSSGVSSIFLDLDPGFLSSNSLPGHISSPRFMDTSRSVLSTIIQASSVSSSIPGFLSNGSLPGHISSPRFMDISYSSSSSPSISTYRISAIYSSEFGCYYIGISPSDTYGTNSFQDVTQTVIRVNERTLAKIFEFFMRHGSSPFIHSSGSHSLLGNDSNNSLILSSSSPSDDSLSSNSSTSTITSVSSTIAQSIVAGTRVMLQSIVSPPLAISPKDHDYHPSMHPMPSDSIHSSYTPPVIMSDESDQSRSNSRRTTSQEPDLAILGNDGNGHDISPENEPSTDDDVPVAEQPLNEGRASSSSQPANNPINHDDGAESPRSRDGSLRGPTSERDATEQSPDHSSTSSSTDNNHNTGSFQPDNSGWSFGSVLKVFTTVSVLCGGYLYSSASSNTSNKTDGLKQNKKEEADTSNTSKLLSPIKNSALQTSGESAQHTLSNHSSSSSSVYPEREDSSVPLAGEEGGAGAVTQEP